MVIRRIFLLFISLIFSVVLSEAAIRVYHRFIHKIPFIELILDSYDKELGWKGKMIFGNKHSSKYKIFFIGDSFTEGCNVDEEKMYYRVVAKALGAEIFVYGGAGYGTLQEYMVISRHFEEIKPDLVILQVCPNDFINNLWELERDSFYNNDLRIRPYFINGKVEYLFPKFPGKFRMILARHSRFLYLMMYTFDKLFADLCKRGFLHTVEEDIYKKGDNFKNYKKAVIVTNVLIEKIKERVGKIPLVVFTVNDNSVVLEQFNKIFEDNNIEFIEDVPKIIRHKQIKGAKLTLDNDTHWNAEGHQICGEILAENLLQSGYGNNRK